MVVAFIGAKKIPRTAELAIRFWEVLSKLVSEDVADIFLFTNEGAFDDACWLIVSQLQMRHDNIRRIYVCGDSDDKLKEIVKGYEKAFVVDELFTNGILAESVRNRLMVDLCDVLVTYCDTSYKSTPRIEEEEETAVAYAKKKKKRIINLF